MTKALMTSASDFRIVQDYTCTICCKELSNKNSLETHQLVHFKESEKLTSLQRQKSEVFQCKICQRPYASQSSLARHVQIHEGTVKRHKCDLCDMEFNFKTSLHLHLSNYHTKLKPYKCTTCGKAFGISSNLKNHERVHTGEKYYVCNYCNEPFSRTTQRTRHMRDFHAHELNEVENTEEKKLEYLKHQKVLKTTQQKQLLEQIWSVEVDKEPEALPRSDRNRRPPRRYTQSPTPDHKNALKSANKYSGSDLVDPPPAKKQKSKDVVENTTPPNNFPLKDFIAKKIPEKNIGKRNISLKFLEKNISVKNSTEKNIAWNFNGKKNPERNLPEKNFSEMKIAEKKIPKKNIPENNLSKEKTAWNFSQKKISERNLPKTNFCDKNIPDKKFPKLNISEKNVAEKKSACNFSEKKNSEKNLPKNKVPEKINSEKICVNNKFPQNDIPGRKFTAKKLPERNIVERNFPEKNFGLKKIAEKNLPENNCPEEIEVCLSPSMFNQEEGNAQNEMEDLSEESLSCNNGENIHHENFYDQCEIITEKDEVIVKTEITRADEYDEDSSEEEMDSSSDDEYDRIDFQVTEQEYGIQILDTYSLAGNDIRSIECNKVPKKPVTSEAATVAVTSPLPYSKIECDGDDADEDFQIKYKHVIKKEVKIGGLTLIGVDRIKK